MDKFISKYGLIFSLADSPYRTAISGSVLKLQESGKLRELKKKWWSAWKPNNTNCEVNSYYSMFCRALVIF